MLRAEGREARISETRRSAHYMAETSFAALPRRTIEQARLLTLDVIGVALLGRRTSAEPNLVSAIMSSVRGRSEATVLGLVHRAAVHCSSPVVPAALAVVERQVANGKEVLRAVALGCEVLIRFGIAFASDPRGSDPSVGDTAAAWNKGWMTTALLAPFGSSTAAVLLCGGDGDVLHNAWGLAANYAPATSRMMLREGLSGKGSFMGVGSANGVLAADLALAGIEGLEDIIGGWMPLIVDVCDPRKLTEGLGERWEVNEVLFKHFAVVGALFPALEAVFALLDEAPPFRSEDIEAVEVEGYGRTIFNAPTELPHNAEAAKANLRYCVAAALVLRDRKALLHDAYTPAMLGDERIRSLARRVSAKLNPTFVALYPRHAELGSVRILLRHGGSIEKEVDVRQLSRYQHPSRRDIAAKFTMIADVVGMPRARTEETIESVWTLNGAPSVIRLSEALQT